jgi:Precorrin isomerase
MNWEEMGLTVVNPEDIERKSFEIITEILGEKELPEEYESLIKRVIHTTADFEYVDTLKFSEHAVNLGIEAIKNGAVIVTDTNMGKSGINKTRLEKLGGKVYCFMADEDVAAMAKANNTTRAVASIDKAVKLGDNVIYVIGNAPTALIRLYEYITNGIIKPKLIIGVPVGFVNVVQSKELIMTTEIPYIVSAGRKGGSNVAAAICNAIIYNIKN